jgi:hypothetical protein
MGVRGEIFSNRVILPNRTYFFNVKENRMGDLYLNIVESKNRDNGGFDRQSVILFADDLQAFLGGFEESLKVLEKAVREKKHTGSAKREGKREGFKRDGEKREGFGREGGKRDGEKREGFRREGGREERPRRHGHDHRQEGDKRGGRRDGAKRVVVRQHKKED